MLFISKVKQSFASSVMMKCSCLLNDMKDNCKTVLVPIKQLYVAKQVK